MQRWYLSCVQLYSFKCAFLFLNCMTCSVCCLLLLTTPIWATFNHLCLKKSVLSLIRLKFIVLHLNLLQWEFQPMPARMEKSSEFKKIWFKIIQAYYVLTNLIHFIFFCIKALRGSHSWNLGPLNWDSGVDFHRWAMNSSYNLVNLVSFQRFVVK